MKKHFLVPFLLCLCAPLAAQEGDYTDAYPPEGGDYAAEEMQYAEEYAAYENEYGYEYGLEDAPQPKTLPTELPGQKPIEPAPVPQEVYIPLFAGTKPYYTVDPADPRLPDNHALLRMKGTVWRSDEIILSTNVRGVVGARRMYLVFGRDRDAVAFVTAPYEAPALTEYPRGSDYISLIPLLETNTYKASPYANRYVEIPEAYRRPTTNAMMSLIPPTPTNLQDDTLFQPQESDPDLPLEEIPAEDMENQEGLAEEFPEDDTYTLSPSTKQPLSFLAQNAEEALTQAVVNIGGLEGGIFVQENRSTPETPYTVLFLALEKDGSLSVYTIQNSFDIRLNTPAIVQARALYKRAFEVRANMKRFVPIENQDTATPAAIVNFFK